MARRDTLTPHAGTVRRGITAAVGIAASTISVAACAGPADMSPSARPTAPASPTSEEDSMVTATHRDGAYSARGWYGSLPSHQDVTLTIENHVVTDVTITTPAEDDVSLGYQQRFADALPAEVIGKPLEEIAVDRLAGSSGCSEGFMNALAEIREKASR